TPCARNRLPPRSPESVSSSRPSSNSCGNRSRMSNERTPRRGVLLIVASPSGAGKTSLCRRLMADHGGLELSVSMTTRGIRPGEVADRDYHFVDDAEFQRM